MKIGVGRLEVTIPLYKLVPIYDAQRHKHKETACHLDLHPQFKG